MVDLICLRDVSLELPIFKSGGQLLRSTLVNWFARNPLDCEADTFTALNNVSLNVASGERLGLVGANGAGKSTLLRVMAQVYPPTTGQVSVNGSVQTTFDLSLGFQPDATGRENILSRLLLDGLSKKECDMLVGKIVDFSEVGHFIDWPLRTYSMGMITRLAFSIATEHRADVLLMDEIIGAGDASFQLKATKRLEDFMRGGSSLVLASHSDDLIRQYCDRAAWIDGGVVRECGAVNEVLNEYHKSGLR